MKLHDWYRLRFLDGDRLIRVRCVRIGLPHPVACIRNWTDCIQTKPLSVTKIQILGIELASFLNKKIQTIFQNINLSSGQSTRMCSQNYLKKIRQTG